ncbi:MAG: hypothetical protein KC731_11615 [Myxococcales bacterium]|nr:hypothetical protein [Myxococcales bacterium]
MDVRWVIGLGLVLCTCYVLLGRMQLRARTREERARLLLAFVRDGKCEGNPYDLIAGGVLGWILAGLATWMIYG